MYFLHDQLITRGSTHCRYGTSSWRFWELAWSGQCSFQQLHPSRFSSAAPLSLQEPQHSLCDSSLQPGHYGWFPLWEKRENNEIPTLQQSRVVYHFIASQCPSLAGKPRPTLYPVLWLRDPLHSSQGLFTALLLYLLDLTTLLGLPISSFPPPRE